MAAWIVGTLGAVLNIWIGTRLGLSVEQLILQVVATNVAGFLAGVVTLQSEKVGWFKAWVIPGGLRTWLFLTMVYLGIQLSLVPSLREGAVYFRLAFPLLMSTGLMINPCMGPTLDWLVRRGQRRARRRQVLSTS